MPASVKDQDGMTLVELLVAELIGGVVITAAITLVFLSFNGSQRVSDRVNSLSQGRVLSAQLEQRINSQVCLYSGEYGINGSTVYTSAADSILYAGPDKMIFFADVNKSGSGGTTSSVGFIPNIRFLYFDPGTNTGANAGRKGAFIDGSRAPSTTSEPFFYSLSPLTGAGALDAMAVKANADLVTPTDPRRIVEGVTNGVTGAAGTTALPFFQYWDSLGNPIAASDGVVPDAQLGSLGHVRVNFRILAESGKDSASNNTSKGDRRTASFSSDVYFRTEPNICG